MIKDGKEAEVGLWAALQQWKAQLESSGKESTPHQSQDKTECRVH
jgi:hypothetical protein